MTASDTENKLGISVGLLIRSAPYGILVLNDALEILDINAAACRILNAENENAVTGKPVSEFLDPEVFRRVMDSGEAVQEACVHLSRDRYVERNIAYDRESGRLLCFMRDITAETVDRMRREQNAKRSIEITDRVIEKQMRVVQEIASLLGETTAETKIALTKLKESLNDE